MSRGFSDHAYLYSTGAATLNFPAATKPERGKHHWGDVAGVMAKKETAERGRHHWGDDIVAKAKNHEKSKVDKHHWEDEGSGIVTGEGGGRLAKTATRESARHHWEDEDAPRRDGIHIEKEVKKKGFGGWFNKLKGQGSDEVVR
ncbi:hypothetical protein MMC11_004326 [Xylographa trunciseda]|nr:hypothetical protein [Xylographa trunciseda]